LFFDGFVLKLNEGMAEMSINAESLPQRKTSADVDTKPGRLEAIALKVFL
jgi:hypothetical protein